MIAGPTLTETPVQSESPAGMLTAAARGAACGGAPVAQPVHSDA
jgi:hypothetical protein